MVITRSRGLDHLRKRKVSKRKITSVADFSYDVACGDAGPDEIARLFEENSKRLQLIQALPAAQRRQIMLTKLPGQDLISMLYLDDN